MSQKNFNNGKARPRTSQPQQLSKEQYQEFLGNKIKPYPELVKKQEQRRSESARQLPNIHTQQQQNNPYGLYSQKKNSQVSMTSQPFSAGGNQPQYFGDQYYPQSAKSHKNINYMRPQSSQFTKPLIVHVEREFKEKQLQKNPSVNLNTMSVYSREDYHQEQEHILQDKLWDQVYYTKNKINELTQSNNDTKAKIWNIEKENRKMQKQIDSWGLQKGVVFDQNNEVFVDSATSEKVYKDENFYAVTMKQQIKDLGEQLYEKQEIIKDYEHKINVFQDEIETINESIMDAQRDVIVNFEKLKDEKRKYQQSVKELERVKENTDSQQIQTLSVERTNPNQGSYPEEDNGEIEQLRFESDDLAEQIAQFQENNKVILFEIQIQKQANKKCEEEKDGLQKRLERKKREIQALQRELGERGVNEDYNEYELKKVRQPQEDKKTDQETLEELEKKIEEQKQQITDLNFTIQKMTQSKIIEKQDNQKEIESSQQEIYEQEEKYLLALTEFLKIKQKDFNKDKSHNQTFYGSDIQIGSISDIEIESDKEEYY